MNYARTLRQARADVTWLVEHWPHLIECRIPGTARPWRQTDFDPARRAELDARSRAERRERVDLAPGESEAPVHVDILDVLADLERTCGSPEALAGWTFDDLPEDGLAAYGRDLTRLVREAALALRLVYDGQRLDGACPWCRQDRSLVIRVPDEDDDGERVTTLPVVVVCEGWARVCEPPERDCGLYVRGRPPRAVGPHEGGRPAWPLWAEGEWLAQRIAHHEATQPQYLLPARPVKVYRVRDEHGREGCWLWQGATADVPGPDQDRSCGRPACVRPDHIVRERETAYG